MEEERSCREREKEKKKRDVRYGDEFFATNSTG